MTLLMKLRRLLGLCEHEFSFLKSVDEQNIRGGYKHRSYIYQCTRCPKRRVVEEPFHEQEPR